MKISRRNPTSNSKKYRQKRIVHFISKITKKWQTFSIMLSLQLYSKRHDFFFTKFITIHLNTSRNISDVQF